VFGLTFGLAVTVGETIGAGILRTPGQIAAQLPTFAPFVAVWIIGGLYALLGANALAELGTMVPRSGGQYVFVRRGLGDYAGFVVGWSDWISTCGSTAVVAIVVGEYAVGLMPSLRAVEMIALALVGTFTVVQWVGSKWGGAAQTATTLLKTVALLLFVAACFWLGSRNPVASSLEPDREGSFFVAFMIALQAVIYTYDGWSSVIYFSEEVKNPGKSIPRSMFGGIIAVIVIYLLINLAFLRVVPLATMAGHNLAAAVVAQHLFGARADLVVRAVTVLALLSAVNSNVLMAPRVIFAMANDRLFWRGAREVNRNGTPDVALLLSSLMAVAFIVTGTFESVLAKLAFFFVANYALSFASLFVLRRTEPDAERPWRAWGHPFTTGIAFVASVAFLIAAVKSDTVSSLYSLALLCLSFPAFLLLRRNVEA
jgi:APA family basic amino acid/polyamine antiporter